MRTSVTRRFHFEAAHQLPWHTGKCRELHGHGYTLDVTIEGPVGDSGIVMDFADLGAVVRREVVDHLDHTYLNDSLENPTAELIAHDIWKRLEAVNLPVRRVRLWETADCYAEVSADRP